MSIRTIVVHADSDDRCGVRIGLAAELARRHNAKIFAVFVRRPPTIPVMEGGYVPADLLEPQIAAENMRSDRIHGMVAEILRNEAITWEWRSVEGELSSVLARTSAAGDIIVMAQDPAGPASPEIAEVALTAGCPVLCIPHSGRFLGLGKRVLVAWNSSRESARALHDALPFLATADVVTLFAADEGEDALATTLDAAARLAAHGAKVEVKRESLGDLDAGNAILNAAADTSADMIVMGAYGHSRLAEWVFGGATRTVLASMTVPVLLAH